MVFQWMARRIKNVTDAYQSNLEFKITANTVALYFGTKAAGIAGTYITGNKDVQDYAELVAPVIGGAYAIKESENLKGEGFKNLAQIALAAMIGWDLSATIYNYYGSNEILSNFRNLYTEGFVLLANKTNIHSPEKMGAIIGGLTGGAVKVREHYKKLK